MKKCSNCGRECEDKDQFCLICGTKFTGEPDGLSKNHMGENRAESDFREDFRENAAPKAAEEAAQSAPQKTSSGKKATKILLMAGAAAVIVLLAVVAVLFLRGDGIQKTDPNAALLVYSEDEEGFEFVTAQGTTVLLEVDNVYQAERSLDGRLCAVLADYGFYEDSGDLYYADEKTVVLVAEGVSSFTFSDEGTGIAYIKGSADYMTGDLYLYSVKDQESTKIDSGVKAGSVCISPDGKSIAYIGSYSNDYSFKGYRSIKGDKPEEMGENIIPIAISDGGKYQYYYELTGSSYDLYVKHRKNEVKLATSMYSGTSVFLNKDYTQLLYIDEGKTYLSENGDTKEKISSSQMQYCVLPDNTASKSTDTTESSIYVYGISDFGGKVVAIDSSLYYLNKDFEPELITGYVYYYQLAADNNSLLYSNGGSLYYIKNIKKSRMSEEIGSNIDIYMFTASDDLSQVYYTDEDDTLYYKKGSKDSRKVADGVYYYYAIRGDDKRFFYLMEYDESKSAGTLYTAKWGRFRKEVSMVDEVYSIFSYNGAVFCYMISDDGYSYDLYISTKGKDFEPIVKGVISY